MFYPLSGNVGYPPLYYVFTMQCVHLAFLIKLLMYRWWCCIYSASMCSSFVMFVSFSIDGDTRNWHVQIGVKADWRGIQGRLVLFIGNKHTGSLSNVRVVVLPPSHLRFQSPPVPDTIPPRAQVSFFSDSCVCISQEFKHYSGQIMLRQ